MDVRVGAMIGAVREKLIDEVPGVVVFTHAEFLQNNIYEMESGILPLLYAVAVIGSIVLTVILTLILSINILEYRADFAVMKALGSPPGFLPGMIVNQALFLSLSALISGIFIFFSLVELIRRLSPEIETITSSGHVVTVIVVVGLMSLLSAFLSIKKLQKILEKFLMINI